MKLNNMLDNFITSVISNPITIAFLVIIAVYSIMKIVENKMLYEFINQYLKEINEHQRRSIFYSQVLEKFNRYKEENSYAEINITSFTEEIAANLTYKKQYILDKIRTLKNASSVCILLGVLGTFVGLSTMLLTVNTNDIINSLPQTISSMQTAFTTSIFGIVFSILLGLFLRIKDAEHVLIQLMLKIENLLTAEVTHAKAKVMDSKIEDVKDTIKQISKSIEAIERFDKISKDLNDFNEDFLDGIESLKQLLEGSESSIKTFDQSVRKLDKQFNIMNIKFTNLFDIYEDQDEINKEILMDIKECTKNIYDSTDNQNKIKDYLESINNEFAVYEGNTKDLLENLIVHEDNVLLKHKELNEQQVILDNSIKNLSNIVSLTSKDVQDKLDMVFNYVDIYNEALSVSKKEQIKPQEAINTRPDEKYNHEEIYEIDNEMELNKNKKMFTVIKPISEDDLHD